MAKDRSWRGKVAAFVALGLLAGMGTWGCQRDSISGPQAEDEKEATPAKIDGAPVDPATDPFHSLRQSFAEATRAEPYADWEPVDKTMAGKPIGPLYEKVKQNWESVKL